MKELINNASTNNQAVGAFSVGNMEMVIGAVKAAEELNTPIILQIAQVRLKQSPLHLMGPMMIHAAERAKVPIAVHLDHGLTLDTINEALNLDFTSVMFDGSGFSLKENISKTKQVVDMARRKNANIEAELGVVGGTEGGTGQKSIVCTDPQVACRFVESTNIDALAVAIGNAHGHYASVPKLRLDILEEIHKKVTIPLVLHGGSGIAAEDFRHCINSGICKINIATADFDALTSEAERYFRQPVSHNYFALNEAMVEGVYANVKKHIQIFNNQIPLDQIS